MMEPAEVCQECGRQLREDQSSLCSRCQDIALGLTDDDEDDC